MGSRWEQSSARDSGGASEGLVAEEGGGQKSVTPPWNRGDGEKSGGGWAKTGDPLVLAAAERTKNGEGVPGHFGRTGGETSW